MKTSVRGGLAALLIVTGLSGCAVFPQIDRSRLDPDLPMSHGGDHMLLDLDTVGANGRPYRPPIDLDKSYAVTGKGVRYPLRVAMDDAAARSGYRKTRWRVRLVDPASDTGVALFWPYGDWHLHLEFKTPSGAPGPVDLRFRTYAVVWTPFIHGAPL
jgi:hypothetical protein